MCSRFKDAFKKDGVGIPSSIVDILSKRELPDGLNYKEIDDGLLFISGNNVKMTITKDNLDIPEKLKDKDLSFIREYMHATQQELIIKGDVIVNEEKINIRDFCKEPFGNKDLKFVEGMLIIQPCKFKKFNLLIHSDCCSKNIEVQRQPNEDINKNYFKRIDEDGLEISYIIDIINKTAKFNISVNIEKCKTIEDVIDNFKWCKMFLDGNVNISSYKIPIENSEYDKKAVDNMIEFYSKLHEICKVLNLKISPSQNITKNDLEEIEKLYRTLILKKPYKEFINMDNIRIASIESIDEETLKNRKGGVFQFYCNAEYEMLGFNINLPTIVAIYNIVVTNIEKKDLKDRFDYILNVTNIKESRIYQSIMHFKDNDNYKQYVEENENIINSLNDAEEI